MIKSVMVACGVIVVMYAISLLYIYIFCILNLKGSACQSAISPLEVLQFVYFQLLGDCKLIINILHLH